MLALSQFLAAWRGWRAAPTLEHAAAAAVLGVGLVAVMGWLGFLLYEVDRAAGRVRHQVGVYEWILGMRREAGPLAPEPASISGPRRGPRANAAETGSVGR